MEAAVLGIISVLGFALSNMVSGIVSNRQHSAVVLVFGRTMGAFALLPFLFLLPATHVHVADVMWSLLGGILCMLGLARFFRSMKPGYMSISNALYSGVYCIVTFLLFLLIGNEQITLLAVAGICIAIVCGVVISLTQSDAPQDRPVSNSPASDRPAPTSPAPTSPAPIATAPISSPPISPAQHVASATHVRNRKRLHILGPPQDAIIGASVLGLGISFLAFTSNDARLVPSFFMQLATGLAAIPLALRNKASLRPTARDFGIMTIAGLGSTVGVLATGIAVQRGVASLVSGLQSITPVIVVVAAALFLKERLTPLQFVAVAGSVIGTALIAFG